MIEKRFKQCLLLQITTALLLLAWDKAPHCGKMGKKLGKQGEPRESGEGKGGNKSVFSYTNIKNPTKISSCNM